MHRGKRTRRKLVDAPQALVAVLALLAIDVLVPPANELDLRVPVRIEDLALNLVARARAAPGRALLERDHGLGARGLVRHDEVADDFEILGTCDEVAPG